jgi:hypothetical protein
MASRSKPPRTEREARYRSRRKLAALEKRAKASLIETAGLWDEGEVTFTIDSCIDTIDAALAEIREAMDETISRHEEEEARDFRLEPEAAR